MPPLPTHPSDTRASRVLVRRSGRWLAAGAVAVTVAAGCSSQDRSSTPTAAPSATTAASTLPSTSAAPTTSPAPTTTLLATTVPATTAPNTTAASTTTSTTSPATVLTVDTIDPNEAPISVPADAHGLILMVKVYVDDLSDAEWFYGQVFGVTTAMEMGDRVHIVTFPDGGPGMVLIQRGADDENQVSSFIVQVPDLAVARDRALANGAEEQGTFAGQPTSEVAQSIDLLDPWGNQIEILQIG